MIKSRRAPVNKRKSAGQFRNNAMKTHPRNMAMAPKRGGWRL